MYNENKTIVFGHEYSSRYSISRHFNIYMYIIQLIVFNLKRNDKCSSKIIHSIPFQQKITRLELSLSHKETMSISKKPAKFAC